MVAGDGASTSLSGGAGVVVLDTDVTPELEAEGVDARSGAAGAAGASRRGAVVSDRIVLVVGVTAAVRDQVSANQAMLADETLATSVSFADAPPAGADAAELDGRPVLITVSRA